MNLHGDQTVQCKWGSGPAGSSSSGGNPGYTGMEGLLNYAYVQTNSLNLFDQLGHALGITLMSAPGANAPCGYQTGPTVPAEGGGQTTDPKNFAECAGILGDRQPGINYGVNPSGLFGNLGRYDASVCPDGSTVPQICDPNVHVHSANFTATNNAATTSPNQGAKAPPAAPTPQQQKQLQKILQGVDPNKLKGQTEKKLKDLLNQLPQTPAPAAASASSASPGPEPQRRRAAGLVDSGPPQLPARPMTRLFPTYREQLGVPR